MSNAIIIIVMAIFLLSGCVDVPADNGFAQVASDARQQTGHTVQLQHSPETQQAIAQEIQSLLQEPLTIDSAVYIGLLNNRDLQAQFDELEIAGGGAREANAFPNPVLTAGHRSGGGDHTNAFGIEFDVTKLIWRAPLQAIASEELRRTQANVSASVVDTALQVRTAFYAWQADEQQADMLATVSEATAAAAALAERQYAAGTINVRDRARQQVMHAETQVDVIKARQTAVAAREAVNRLLALQGDNIHWTASTRLPEPPRTLPTIGAAETTAINNSKAIEAARADLAYYAKTLELTRSSRFLNMVSFGADYEKDSDAARQRGPSLSIELPLFNQGDARLQQDAARYRQAEQRLYQQVVNAASETRTAVQAWRDAHAVVEHYRNTILPLHQQVLEQTQLHYNGMLDDIYELLADRREQVRAGIGYIEALRDFHIAHARLEQALGMQLPLDTVTTPAAGPANNEPTGHEGHH